MLTRLLTFFTLLFCIAIPAQADLKIIYTTPGFGTYYNSNQHYSNNKHANNYAKRHNFGNNQHITNPYLNHNFSLNHRGYKTRNTIKQPRYGYVHPGKRYYSRQGKSYKRGYQRGYYDALNKYARRSYYRH